MAMAMTKPSSRTVSDLGAVLNAVGSAIIVVDANDRIRFTNHAAEQMLGASSALLHGQRLAHLIPDDSPLFSLLEQVRRDETSVSEAGIRIEGPRVSSHSVTVDGSPLPDEPGAVVLLLRSSSIVEQIDRQLNHRHAARSVMAMAAMLAHEVKNPLSGIRGAAQLLEQNAADPERELTRLIVDETDRIVGLVDRMDAFADQRPLKQEAINIHQVLEHVRKLAQAGATRPIRFIESYDPSLPPVRGSRDQLIQVFLNLVKNAADALPDQGGEIEMKTRYRHGVRLAVPGQKTRLALPLEVVVRDNGGGIPDDLRPHLFDPFVTTKPHGSGLGLALAAKIVGDHGGIIDVESEPRRTEFRVILPRYREVDS